MEDLKTRINPISKIEIYNACKKVIFSQMENDIITPERADEILWYTKEHVIRIWNPEQAKEFYIYIAKKFPELKDVEINF